MMDRKTLLTVLIMLGFFIGWEKFYMDPRRQAQVSASATKEAPASVALGQGESAPGSLQPQSSSPVVGPETTVAVDMGSSVLTLTNRAKLFKSWELKKYRESLAKDAMAISLGDLSHQADGLGEILFDRPEYLYLSKVSGELKEEADRVVWTYQDQNVHMTRTVLKPAPGALTVDLEVAAEFAATPARNLFISLTSETRDADSDIMDRKLVRYAESEFKGVELKGSVEQAAIPHPIRWAGLANRYFLMSLLSADSNPTTGLVQGLGENRARIMVVYPVQGNRIQAKMKAFFGPKELGLLRKVDPTLESTIDFGFFTLFAYPLLRFMKLLNDVVSNWGVAIILLTIAVKLLTFPLTYKSMKSMKQMAKINPQLQKLREKYADDKEALNREMMVLMKTQGYNPVAGCLPILIQMPVFFALYRVLYSSTELYQAPFMLWIHDLSAKDPLYITPVLLTAVMFIQQKLTPNTATDPVQAKMLQFMPVMFGVFMLQLPAGLTLYMLVNALASIVQQVLMNRKFAGDSAVATA
jgi:YidC/Oxa1 family membrane protein insertase